MKNKILENCILLFKEENIKNNIKDILYPIIKPLINNLLKEINPYLYLSLIFVFISFLLHLGIFIILIQNRFYNNK